MSNLVSISKLQSVIASKGLTHLIDDVGYSKVKNKKYFVHLKSGKTVNFGYKPMEDYLIHGDNKRRERYRARHRNDKIHDPNYPGFWSWSILW